MERLVRRMGHHTVGIGDLSTVDILLFEPESRAGLALAKLLLEVQPDASLVACSSAPVRKEITMPRVVASLLQPFSPADLAKVLETCCRPHTVAA